VNRLDRCLVVDAVVGVVALGVVDHIELGLWAVDTVVVSKRRRWSA